MNNKLENILKRLMLGLFAALVFFTPIIFTSITAEFYEFPKMFFVYFTGTTLIALFFIYRTLFKSKKWFLPDKLVLAYFTSIVVSAAFSSHLYTSLWGYYSRFNGGLVSYLVFFGIYFVSINYLDENKKQKLINISSLTLFPVSLYGIFQISNYSRIFSTLGQPNWLASYIVFLIPVVIGNIVMEKVSLKRYFWIFTMVLAFANLWFTSSLSGVVGLVASLLYLALSFRKNIFNKWTLIGVVLFLVIGVLNFSFFKARISDAFVFSTDPESYKVSDPALIRAGLWQGSLRLSISSFKNFMIGTGPETFPYQFPLYRPDFLNYSSEWDFILNKPHNYYLEILAESGIIALVFYLLLIIKTVIKGFRSQGFNKNQFLISGLVGFFVTNFFGWPTVYTSLLFWLWLSFLSNKNSFDTA